MSTAVPGNELDRPILVTGTPRSGKSCIATILDRLDECVHVSEPLMIWNAGMGSKPDDRRNAEEVTDALRYKIIKGCVSLIADHPGVRYVDDLSHHALRIPFTHALLPNARIINVIRSPRGAIPEMLYGWTYHDTLGRVIKRRRHSIRLTSLPRLGFRFFRNQITQRLTGRKVTWGPRVPGFADYVANSPMHMVASYQWMMMIQIAMDDIARLPADSVLNVRFERLLANPAAEAERIGAFCQVKETDALAAHARTFMDPHHEYDRRVDLTDEQWAEVDHLIAPLQRTMTGGDQPATA